MRTNREKVWLEAWCAVASAANTRDRNVPSKWADQALKDFDERFPQNPPCKQVSNSGVTEVS